MTTTTHHFTTVGSGPHPGIIEECAICQRRAQYKPYRPIDQQVLAEFIRTLLDHISLEDLDGAKIDTDDEEIAVSRTVVIDPLSTKIRLAAGTKRFEVRVTQVP